MIRAVRTCLANYVTFSGRARRPEFWWFVLFGVLLNALAAGLDGVLFGPARVGPDGAAEYGGGPIASLAALALFPPSLAAGWRRMHDTGRPGWFYLLPAVVGIGGLIVAAIFAAATLRADAAVAGWALGLVAATALAAAAAWALLVVWLAGGTQPGPNAYGPEPAPW